MLCKCGKSFSHIHKAYTFRRTMLGTSFLKHLAKASRLGVTISGLCQLTSWKPKSSATIKIMLGGLLLFEANLTELFFTQHWLLKYKKKSVLMDTLQRNWLGKPLTLLGGGAESARPFFRWLFLHEKGGLEVQNFVTFPNSLWTFRKSKKIFFGFSQCFGVI